MRTALQLVIALSLASTAAFANEHLKEIAGSAKTLHQEFLQIRTVLKSKDFSADTLRQNLTQIEPHLTQLRTLASKFEETKPALSGEVAKQWNTTKEMIELLNMFHQRKAELLQENPSKNRGLLRLEAERLAHRANVLHQSANRLASTLGM